MIYLPTVTRSQHEPGGRTTNSNRACIQARLSQAVMRRKLRDASYRCVVAWSGVIVGSCGGGVVGEEHLREHEET